MSMSNFLSFLVIFFPWRLKRYILVTLLDYEIDKTAYIGFSLVDVGKLKMGKNSSIGHLNIIRSMLTIDMRENASIGNLNWITGVASYVPNNEGSSAVTPGMISIGKHTSVTNRHYLDCSGGFEMGSFSILAGVKTTLVTHSIDIYSSRQKLFKVTIGSYCFVGTNSILLMGSKLPDYSILGAGSILTKTYNKPYSLYAGNPAKPVKELPKDLRYFLREVGHVD